MTKPAVLTAYLFDGQPHLLSGDLTRWMEGSARCSDFVEAYRDKIRKKIRITSEPESILDLRAELEVACSLLDDRRLFVAYEPYASAKRRGPDFSVTYRANLVFNIEVTRLHAEENGLPAPGKDPPGNGIELARKEERILHIMLDKLGQMQPGMPNLLVIHTRGDLARSIDLAGLIRGLKSRVELKDPAFFAASGYAGPDDFYKEFLHLNGILLWAQGAQPWANRQARPVLPEKILRLVGSLAANV